jgi:DnaJ-class molecular chaperone
MVNNLTLFLTFMVTLFSILNSAGTGNKKNYYDVLGVKQEATSREIKKQFHILSRKFHPDHAKGGAKEKEASSKKMAAVTEAYATLSDPDKRKKYDLTLSDSFGLGDGGAYGGAHQQQGFHGGQAGGGFTFGSDFFKTFFGGSGGGFDIRYGSGGSGFQTRERSESHSTQWGSSARKPATKPATKRATEPATKPSTKPTTKTTASKPAKPTTKPATKPTTKPTTKPAAKPTARTR